MNETILITGGAGFIGSHVSRALARAGHRVRVLDSLIEQVHGGRGPALLDPEVEFIEATCGTRPRWCAR
jgi:dTDP-L-rhamnose 4-epimerase